MQSVKCKARSVKFGMVLGVMFLLLPCLSWAVDDENYTYKLTQSTSAYQLWTTPPSERVFKTDTVPSDTGSDVKVYAAQNEFEPFIVVVKPTASGTAKISIGSFGSGITAEIYQVKYVNITQASDSLGKTGYYPDPLWPVENNASVSLTANENTAFWFSLSVSKTVPKGDYTANVTIGTITIPVKLHVFGFAIPDELHVHSQMGFSDQTVLTRYGVTGTGDNYWTYVNKIKQFLIDHRLTPSSVLWPGGLTGGGTGGAPFIDYDCNTGIFTDNDGIWGFVSPSDKYLKGNSFNDRTGFSSFMAMGFQNNDSSADQRPSTFCGLTKGSGDWYTANNPSSAYNKKWFKYIGDIQTYLNSLGYLSKAYYYFANEPQDQADYDAVAWYARELKKAASNLKIMVSEEPKTEIYANSKYPGAKIDIWLPVLNNYNPDVSQAREKNNGEATWIYFLHGTRPPYFNPITLDHPGIESKLTGWFLWKYRIRGIAYYSINNWTSQNPWTSPMTDGHNGDTFMLYPPSTSNTNITYGSNNHRFVSSIRFELMRDSLEDYEYLYVLNSSKRPEVGVTNSSDTLANKMVSGTTSYTRNSRFVYNLRRLTGLKNGNEISSIPDIKPPPSHIRSQGAPGNYYINFQNPTGSPTANPLVVDGKTYMKIGWNAYSETLGYGWYGDMSSTIKKYQYFSSASVNELQKSVIYDDYGLENTFEFDLPNGTYSVTVSVGWPDKTYSHNKVVVEGVPVINDEASSPYLVRTKIVTVSDYKLTMNTGIKDQYTMLNYMTIREAVTGNIDGSGDTDLKDVIVVLQILAGLNPVYVNLSADINGDGKIGLPEAIYILQRVGWVR